MSNELKQMRRQSSDFKEVWNTQTELNVTQEKWDAVFHNWEHPELCNGAKRVTGCTVCDKLKKYGYVTDKFNNIFGIDIAIVGDIHSNYKGLEKLIDANPSLIAVICVGDLALWKNIEEAKEDKKAFNKTETEIRAFLTEMRPFKIPVYVVKGNHDDYNNMYTDWFKKLNIHYVQQADVLKVGNLKIGCIGGVYSSLRIVRDSSSFIDREQRFYTNTEIEDLAKQKDVNVLITHQAARTVLQHDEFTKDEGSDELQYLLDALKPEYYIHGHHHRNYKIDYNNTKVIGLGNFSKNETSYIIINALSKEVK